MSSKSQEHSSTSQPESRQARPSGKTIITILLILIGVLALDQISKSIVVAQLPLFPEEGSSIAVIGDFLRITHLTNDAMLFSIGRGLGNLVKRILFTGLPLLILLWLLYMLFFDKSLHTLMRYQFALIAGGGLGNLSDRLFRGGIVVDFIDVKFYGIFGLERWPTFNVADSAVVVGVILFFVFSFAKREN